jgi:hypothetical protein
MDEPSLDERIALLTSLLTDPADDADVPALNGYLGGSQLEKFERDGTPDDLDASITRLHAVLAVAPGHPDAMYWYHGLGVAYSHRAASSHEIADHSRAVHWLNRLHDRFSDSDEERDYATVLLMDAHWDRSPRSATAEPATRGPRSRRPIGSCPRSAVSPFTATPS